MDDEPRILETKRFWRLNSIEGLKMMHTDTSRALDPEHLEQIKANKAELNGLLAREMAVKARHAKIYKLDQAETMTTKKPAVQLDGDEWENGYIAGVTGKPGKGPQGLAYSSGLIEGKADKGIIPINPKLRPDFDNTPNEDRSPAEIAKWWDKPFIVTTTYEQTLGDKTHADYVARVKEWNEKANFPTTPRDEWEKQRAEQKIKWFESFPSGTRYEVRCLDGGGWDRSTWRGTFAKLSEAVSFAKSGQTFTAHRPGNKGEEFNPQPQT